MLIKKTIFKICPENKLFFNFPGNFPKLLKHLFCRTSFSSCFLSKFKKSLEVLWLWKNKFLKIMNHIWVSTSEWVFLCTTIWQNLHFLSCDLWSKCTSLVRNWLMRFSYLRNSTILPLEQKNLLLLKTNRKIPSFCAKVKHFLKVLSWSKIIEATPWYN